MPEQIVFNVEMEVESGGMFGLDYTRDGKSFNGKLGKTLDFNGVEWTCILPLFYHAKSVTADICWTNFGIRKVFLNRAKEENPNAILIL